MELLFKRSQTATQLQAAKFELYSKIELDADEKEIANRYRIDKAILITRDQPNLLRDAGFVAAAVFFVSVGVLLQQFGLFLSVSVAAIAGGLAGVWFWNEKRETIMVKDLIHGRYFKCESVIELARKEAWLELVVGYLRQVMESAKHWDGTERHTIKPLTKDKARQVIIGSF